MWKYFLKLWTLILALPYIRKTKNCSRTKKINNLANKKLSPEWLKREVAV
jgi:hypothetical protein